jgi:hypothetical protein
MKIFGCPYCWRHINSFLNRIGERCCYCYRKQTFLTFIFAALRGEPKRHRLI